METPLVVHVLYHHDFSDGPAIYEYLYKLLCRNPKTPFDPGLDIPVFFKTDIKGEISCIDLKKGKMNFVLLLVDQNMYLSTEWKKYVNDVLIPLIEKKNESIQIIPVSLYKYAYDFSSKLAKCQFISINNESILEHEEEFNQRLYDCLIRFLKYLGDKRIEPLKIFISHSKHDEDKHGKVLAENLRDYFQKSGSKLGFFFDVNSIIEGYNFEDQLTNNAQNAIMIVILSETYSSREWCIKEILAAKKNDAPVIVVYTINNSVDRIFPYIGNVPGTSFNGDWTPVVNLLLRTTLSYEHQKKLLSQFTVVSHIPHTPDAFSLYNFMNNEKRTAEILYPEPPLGYDEMEIINGISRKMFSFFTPIQYQCKNTDLNGRTIAFSMSDSIEADNIGIGKIMLDDAINEVIRSILMAKGKIAYSGNIRKDGLTYKISDISYQYAQYEQNSDKSNNNLESKRYATAFIAWPYNIEIDKDALCEFQRCRVEYVAGEPADCVNDIERIVGPLLLNKDEAKKKISASMTLLRNTVESYDFKDFENNEHKLLARIFIGGKLHGYGGSVPGLKEEFDISVKNGTPIFMLGGFGGMTKQIIERKDFNRDILHNGLSEDDNETLFKSTNIFDIIPTLLRGLDELIKNGR